MEIKQFLFDDDKYLFSQIIKDGKVKKKKSFWERE